jgi:hypothetical protein
VYVYPVSLPVRKVLMSYCRHLCWDDAIGTRTDVLLASNMKAHSHCCANSDESKFVEVKRNVRNTNSSSWNTRIANRFIT